jgi:hypothetical protein
LPQCLSFWSKEPLSTCDSQKAITMGSCIDCYKQILQHSNRYRTLYTRIPHIRAPRLPVVVVISCRMKCWNRICSNSHVNFVFTLLLQRLSFSGKRSGAAVLRPILMSRTHGHLYLINKIYHRKTNTEGCGQDKTVCRFDRQRTTMHSECIFMTHQTITRLLDPPTQDWDCPCHIDELHEIGV